MTDINKYLESQLALAKRKCVSKKLIGISSKSKSVADIISQKQTILNKDTDYEKVVRNTVSIKPSSSKHLGSDEEEYLPSGEEDDEYCKELPSLQASSRSRQIHAKKIIDDGDLVQYNERIKRWRNFLSLAESSNFEGQPCSADIQYVLEGNTQVNDIHELQNGFCIPNYIWKQLYKYQKTGVKWLWELHQVQSGGMLGDEMGLGKTIQIIAFLAGLSKTDLGSWGGLGPSIIIAPATVIYQWVSHFHYWYPSLRVAVLHHSGSHNGTHNKLIRDLHVSHGILLITYAGVVKYIKDLLACKWHYIILDEGHKIRNPDTQVSKLVKQFRTPHRLLITGSPMQNSLQELWSLFDFMRPGLLGTHNAFMDHFATPITQGGYANATEFQEATALEIAIALKQIITPYMLRRTKAEVQDSIKLPEKKEQVLFCALSQEQRDLYMGYLLSSTVRSILDKNERYEYPMRARILVALSTLRKICNHPDLYLYEAQEDSEIIDETNFGHWKRSGKMTVVNSLLNIWKEQGHRTLIFTQSRAMLCLLESYLLTQEFKYLKMDGTIPVSQRHNLIKTFNENTEYLVFLATTRVGGLGINLTGANRVIIYDPDWNPATDDQAKERAWRIGQLRNVTVYRLLSAGTIEEKIYQRQIFKHFLSNRILVDPNQKNVLTTSTLQGLFTLEDLNCEGDTETASLFKHTKIKIDGSKMDKGEENVKKKIAQKKLEAMKKMAREISKKISIENEQKVKDPREEYKKKREQIINPPDEKATEVNLINDKETNVSFENAMSELDIVNMHVKEDYEENLIKEVLGSKNTEEKELEDIKEDTNYNIDKEPLRINPDIKSNLSHAKNIIQIKKKSKRKHSTLKTEIENLVAVKKIKRKKHKHTKARELNDDDYILSKLFSKANVKNALQHDVVIGLAEKEKKHMMKEEATKRAKEAIRAIKFSYKR